MLRKNCWKIQILSLIALLCATVGCSEKKGTLDISIYGEDYVEKGIPQDVFPDGWSVKFSTFEVGLSNVVAHSKTGKEYQLLSKGAAPKVFNLVSPPKIAENEGMNGQLVDAKALATGAYTLSFTLGPYHIAGVAEKEGKKVRFDWKIDEKTYYGNCDSYVNVEANQTTDYEITVHADHLFFSNTTNEPTALIHPIVFADKNGDGVVTVDELKEVSADQFDAGKNSKPNNFWEFIQLQARTVGHVNGETHCKDMMIADK